MNKRLFWIGIFFALSAAAGFSLDRFNREDAFIKLIPNAELGAAKVLNHTIQLGENGDLFDYVKNGGQEILFFFQRYSLDISIGKRNTVTFLYQPLTLNTTTRVPADRTAGLTVENTTFPAGTGIHLKYGFDFYRISYLFSIVDTRAFTFQAGLSLQLRNASIIFESIDGTNITVNQNLGPVPILKIRTEYRTPGGYFIGFEADGFYASSAIFNGADFEFTGWIYDAALRGGLEVNPATDAFLSVRVLGGGATGQSEYISRYWTESTTGYTKNSLTTLVLSFGLRLK